MADDYLINFKVEGAPAAQAAAQSVSGSLGEVGQAAETGGGGLGNITAGLGRFGAKAAAAAAALKLVQVGLGEIAEDDRAAQALRKAGLSAEQAAKAMSALEDIELFTGDKVAAARLYGDVLNGKTRELKGYGITLAETATIEEKMEVIAQLRRRGLELDQARIGTLTGEWDRFKHGLENVIGGAATGIAKFHHLSEALGWVNKNVLRLDTEMPKLTDAQVKAAKEAEALAKAERFAAAGVAEAEEGVKALTAALDANSAAQKRNRDAAKENDDAETALQKAQVDLDEASGAATKQQAEERRLQIDFDKRDRELGQKRDDAAEREKLLNQKEADAKASVKLGDYSDAVLRGDPEAAGRIRQADAQLAEIAKARAELEREKAIIENQRKENDTVRSTGEKKLQTEELNEAKETAKQLQNAEDERRKRAQAFLDDLDKDEEAIFKRRKANRIKAEKEIRDGWKKLGDEIAKGEEKIEKAEEAAENKAREKGDDGHPRDSRGRKKITSPKSSNELPALPKPAAREPLEIIVGAAEGAADKTKQSAEQAGKAMDAVGKSVAANTDAVSSFASTMQARLDALTRDLAGLQRRAQANA